MTTTTTGDTVMEAKTLKTALDILDKFTCKRIEVLSYAYLDANGLRATDMDSMATYRMDTGVDTPLLLNVKQSKAAIKACKESVNIATADNRVSLNNVSMKTFDASDFPIPPDHTPTHTILLDAPAFFERLERVLPAVSVDETRPALTNILFEVSAGILTLAATDSYRLHVTTMQTYGAEDVKLLVPGSTLRALVASHKKIKADTVTISTDGERSLVTFGPLEILSRSADASRYPNYRQLITDHRQGVTVDRVAILAALDTVKSMKPRGKYNLVPPAILHYNGNAHITVSFAYDDQSYTETLDCNGDEPIRIGFNASFLADTIRATADDGDTVKVYVSTPLKPAVVCGGNVQVMLMPIRIDE